MSLLENFLKELDKAVNAEMYDLTDDFESCEQVIVEDNNKSVSKSSVIRKMENFFYSWLRTRLSKKVNSLEVEKEKVFQDREDTIEKAINKVDTQGKDIVNNIDLQSSVDKISANASKKYDRLDKKSQKYTNLINRVDQLHSDFESANVSSYPDELPLSVGDISSNHSVESVSDSVPNEQLIVEETNNGLEEMSSIEGDYDKDAISAEIGANVQDIMNRNNETASSLNGSNGQTPDDEIKTIPENRKNELADKKQKTEDEIEKIRVELMAKASDVMASVGSSLHEQVDRLIDTYKQSLENIIEKSVSDMKHEYVKYNDSVVKKTDSAINTMTTEASKQINRYLRENKNLEATHKKDTQIIQNQVAEISEKDEKIQQLEGKLRTSEKENDSLREQVTNQSDEIYTLTMQVQKLTVTVATLTDLRNNVVSLDVNTLLPEGGKTRK